MNIVIKTEEFGRRLILVAWINEAFQAKAAEAEVTVDQLLTLARENLRKELSAIPRAERGEFMPFGEIRCKGRSPEKVWRA